MLALQGSGFRGGGRLSISIDHGVERDAGLQQELKLTARLGAPLALGELGWMSTYIVDALMIGRLPHSALPIAASSLGNTIYYALVFCVINGLDGVETLVAQSYGRGGPHSREDCVRTLAQSMWFVLLGTPLTMLATLASLPMLARFGTPPEIVAEVSLYVHALVWSTAPLLLFMALRRYLQSINRVLLITFALLSATLVNAAGDWAFLYGHLGAHILGIAGSGWATTVVRFYMAGVLLAGFLMDAHRQKLRLSWRLLRPDVSRLRLLGRIGWPRAAENLTDLGFSMWMSIVCARLGTTLLAAHQVVLDLDAFVYMVPQGLSYATVARVGQSAGHGSLFAVRRSARASLILAVGFIAVAGSLFVGFPRLWAGMYTNDAAVVAVAAPVFLICGFNQLGDAVNVIFCSALTGLGDTRTPFVANTAVYWIIGAPLSYWLAFHTALSLRGLWIGRASAALLTAAVMAVVWRLRLRQAGSRQPATHLALLQPLHERFMPRF